jgi:hypothetical protein
VHKEGKAKVKMSAPMSAAMSISLLVMIGLCGVWVDVTEQMVCYRFQMILKKLSF